MNTDYFTVETDDGYELSINLALAITITIHRKGRMVWLSYPGETMVLRTSAALNKNQRTISEKDYLRLEQLISTHHQNKN